MALQKSAVSELEKRLPGRVFGPDSYASEIAGFNLAVVHRPEVVVAACTAEDVVVAIRFARERGLSVTVQSTGHGAEAPIASGLLISTRALNSVEVDPEAKRAIVGAGARWGAVVAAAAGHGLLPIA